MHQSVKFIIQRAKYHCNYLKEKINENETEVSFNFSKNFRLIHQDKIQMLYWRNNQTTIFPIVIHLKILMNAMLKTSMLWPSQNFLLYKRSTLIKKA